MTLYSLVKLLTLLHSKSHNKLDHFGVRTNALELMRLKVSNRNQKALLNDT